MYVLAAAALIACACQGWTLPTLLLGWFIVASLVSAEWIYEKSGLHQMQWLVDNVQSPTKIVVACAGYDELQGRVSTAFPNAQVQFVDFYNALPKREKSIERARKFGTAPQRPVSENFCNWPVQNVNLVLVAFAAHELRDEQSRTSLLKEAASKLAPEGIIVVVEQLRDVSNLLAFGPGFLHFYSRGQWLKDFAASGLRIKRELKLSPFATVFVLCKTNES